MPIPFTQSDSSRATGRRRVNTGVWSIPVHPVRPHIILSKFAPLLDLLAELIVPSIWRQRGVLDQCVDREASNTESETITQGSLTAVLPQPGKSGPFPSFPAVSQLKCQQIPTGPPQPRPQ
jgi:hypothetical protein